MSIPGVDLRVEIAFDSGYRTAAVDRTWTDVSDFVELEAGVDIDYGRSDELGTADANRLTLTLDNTDGRFTWGNAASPYYPNVKIGRPIRVVAVVGGVEHVRFTGYVNEWPVSWPGGGDTYAAAPIAAASRLSRIGLNSPIADTLEKTLSASEPDLYWPLTELSGKVAKESQGRAPDLADAANKTTFGVSPDDFPLDGRPIVQVSAGSINVGDTTLNGGLFAEFQTPIPFSGSITFGLFIRHTDPEPYVSGTDFFGFYPDDSTGATGMSYDRPEYPVHPSELEGVHHLAFTREQTSPTTFTLTNYLDGEVLRQVSGSATPYTKLIRLVLPNPESGRGPIQYGRFAMWDRVLSPDEIAEIALVGLGLAGQTTDERVQRLASWAFIPPAEVVTTPSPITMIEISPEGGQVVELMRHAESTEAGVLYDDREGNLVLLPRTDRYGAPVEVVLDAASQHVGSDFAPKVGRDGLVNIATGRNASGTVEVTYADTESREDYGDEAYSVETHAEDPDEPLLLAAAQVNANKQPRPRAPSVTIHVLHWLDGPDVDEVLGLDIGSKVQIANAPDQAPAPTADYFTEGYTESFGKAEWSISLNLSTAWPIEAAMVLDDPVLGELDADNLLAL